MFKKGFNDPNFERLLEQEAMNFPSTDVVVSGMAGRFPKADSVAEFEENLLKGIDMINMHDDARYQCGLFGLPTRVGRLKDISKFDNEFFGISTEEANVTDYQLRMMLEVVYESILDAGLNPAQLRGSKTGLFVGLFHCHSEFALGSKESMRTGYVAKLALRVAQYFDLRGINCTLDTACASGLSSLHEAVQAIREGLIEQAVVCAVNSALNPEYNVFFLRLQMLSPQGNSRFLDSRADGFVKAEACVAFLLQRKQVALRHYTSFLASYSNADGFTREGITFPSSSQQQALLCETMNSIGLSTDNVEYIEAHGTGTPVGDKAEADAIANVYTPLEKKWCSKKRAEVEGCVRKIGPLFVGSSKSNMGHSLAAAGLCSMTKVALMLENELIYRDLNFKMPNPRIKALIDRRLAPVLQTRELTAKIVPVSSFGFGGANTHVIVRASDRPAIEYGDHLSLRDTFSPRLVVMFGRSKAALKDFFDSMLDEHSRATRNCLTDDFLALMDTINAGLIDRLMDYRGYLLIDRRARAPKRELARGIARCRLMAAPALNLNATPWNRPVHVQESKPRRCNLILPGLGCHWSKMAAGLYGYPPFWSIIRRLAVFLTPFKDEIDLIRLMTESSEEELDCNIQYQTVIIIAYEIALINIIRDQIGLNNLAFIVGHSLGEVSAAYAVGLLDEREAIMIAYRLSKSIHDNQHLFAGKMVAVALTEEETVNLIKEGRYESVRVSCINGLKSVTVSGIHKEIDSFTHTLRQREVTMKILHNGGLIFHNSAICTDEIKVLLKDSLSSVMNQKTDYNREQCPNWLSCLPSGTSRKVLCQANAEYFAEVMCKKVDFLSALELLEEDSIVLELAPSGIFESQVRWMEKPGVQGVPKFHYIKLMKRSTPVEEQQVELLKNLGELYLVGATFSKLTKFNPKMNNSSTKGLFPVRRQTPSLSSMFKWNHEQEFFVPRYPDYVETQRVNTTELLDVIGNENQKYLNDHLADGRKLYPAAGYLFLVWKVFSALVQQEVCSEQDPRLVPVEFHKVRLLQPIVLGAEKVELSVEMDVFTGRFVVTNSESLLVEGFVNAISSDSGLLHESVRQKVLAERLELPVKKAAIYKQLRVHGYDYGPQFQNIEECSRCARHSRIKYNGSFIAFADSLLQACLLTKKQYFKTQLLPAGIEYVRIQSDTLREKIEQFGLKWELSAPHDEERKKIIMLEMLGEECKSSVETRLASTKTTITEIKCTGIDSLTSRPCLFDAHCDPTLDIFITDGFEVRGLQFMPVARIVDLDKVSRRSLHFIKDLQDFPQEEALLCPFDHTYLKLSNSLAFYLLTKLLEHVQIDSLELQNEPIFPILGLYEERLVREYHIKAQSSEGNELTSFQDTRYSIFQVLNSMLEAQPNLELTEQTLAKFKINLAKDVISIYPFRENLISAILEVVVENICQERMQIKLFEINEGEGLMHSHIKSSLETIKTDLKIEYLLAYRDNELLSTDQVVPSGEHEFKIEKLRNLKALLKSNRMREKDLIIYKDASCYYQPKFLKKEISDLESVKEIVVNFSSSMKAGAFVLFVTREKLTLAERTIFALFEEKYEKGNTMVANQIVERLNHMNLEYEERCKALIREACKKKLLLVQKKGDKNGYLLLLFKKQPDRVIRANSPVNFKKEQTLIRVVHDNRENIDRWLRKLRREFEPAYPGPRNATQCSRGDEDNDLEGKACARKQVIWLCAVATRQQPISGLIGLMKTLRKEQDSRRLRCYFDCHTFAQCDEPITETDIESCSKFQDALNRDLVWNCVDAEGDFGAYRHLSTAYYLSHKDSLCTKQITTKEEDEHELMGSATRISNYFYATTSRMGDLTSFSWFEAPFRFLEKEKNGELVKVAYSALNFRDVMLATGRLPPGALPFKQGLRESQIGFEFSGYDARGKPIMAMVEGRAIASHVFCPDKATLKLEVPDGISLAEAATIPVVYATAIMALICRGKARRGESVLIHTGSGGVGQAAIRMASHLGLEVYTTVGGREKRDFLLQEFGFCLSDERIFSSRNCDFEQRILELTEGRGVDLVINSLTDDKLQASVRCLADNGRFLEIGKYDSALDRELELLALDMNKTFHGVHLDRMFDSTVSATFKRDLKNTLEIIKDGLSACYVKPIKYTVFEKHNIEEAFRFMATGKHIGKVLIEMSGEEQTIERNLAARKVPRFQVSAKKSYIVTGGLGGFGLELIKWLVELGARYFFVTSRSGTKSEYQRLILNRLTLNYGAKIIVVDSLNADTTKRTGVEKLCQLALDLSPTHQIGAVFHLAMVLKDALIENVSADDFQLVCRPKVDTFVYLDTVTREMSIKLDCMVAFSSVASAYGNPGQASYSYANACLEQVCEKRRRDGLHGLAIQWGLIGDVGIASELFHSDTVIADSVPQRIASCMATLNQLLCTPFSVCCSVVEEKKKREECCASDLVLSVLHILGIQDISTVNEGAELVELGLDSLMSVEVRQLLIRELDLSLDQHQIRALTIKYLRELNTRLESIKNPPNTNNARKSNLTSKKSKVLSLQGQKPVVLSTIETDQQEIAQTDIAAQLVSTANSMVDELYSINDESFVPPLSIAIERFLKLNANCPSDDSVLASRSSTKRPLFFIAAPQGDFSAFEKICSAIERPCIGINWTYELSRQDQMDHVIELYLELLKDAARSEDLFGRCKDEEEDRVIDLVGHSFGAVIAFELMATLHKRQRKAAKRIANGLNDNITNGLRAGHLIMLDYSPCQAELQAGEIATKCSKGRGLNESIMSFLVAYANKSNDKSELALIYENILQLDDQDKLKLASEKLAALLDKKSSRLGAKSVDANSSKSDFSERNQNLAKQAKEIEGAIEAFHFRRLLMSSYKSSTTLPASCALIMASQSCPQSSSNDIHLEALVEGEVELSRFAGTSYTFLADNSREIGHTIDGYLASSAQANS